MRNTFMNTIIDACKKRDDIFILSGDAGLGVFDEFKEEHPSRFINMGVAEQNTISFAAGLAISGYKVYIYNIIPFVLYRCYEQVRNDICYQELPIVLVGIGSGITYAPMGMTHYSVEDIGIGLTLPNLTIISPIDPLEAASAAEYSLSCQSPTYVRLAKRGEPVFHTDSNIDITKPHVIRPGSNTAILFHGSISNEVLEAYEILGQRTTPPLLISVPTLQPIDKKAICDVLCNVSHVISVEEHFCSCGLGSILSRLKSEHNVSWKLTTLGIPNRFIHEVNSTASLRSLFNIASQDIVHAFDAHNLT
jgi:transketolase